MITARLNTRRSARISERVSARTGVTARRSTRYAVHASANPHALPTQPPRTWHDTRALVELNVI